MVALTLPVDALTSAADTLTYAADALYFEVDQDVVAVGRFDQPAHQHLVISTAFSLMMNRLASVARLAALARPDPKFNLNRLFTI